MEPKSGIFAKRSDLSLQNHFLVAMPGMRDERFARSVIYMCAHSDEGAMGIIINQVQELQFPDLMVQLGILDEKQAIRLPSPARDIIIRNGGPVDRSRGFVLHSDDYMVESKMPVSDDICLTATVDILRAISSGRGNIQYVSPSHSRRRPKASTKRLFNV